MFLFLVLLGLVLVCWDWQSPKNIKLNLKQRTLPGGVYEVYHDLSSYFQFKKFRIRLYTGYVFVFKLELQSNQRKSLKFTKNMSNKGKLQIFITCDSYHTCGNLDKVDFLIMHLR